MEIKIKKHGMVAIMLLSAPTVSAKQGWEWSVGTGAATNYEQSVTIKMDSGDDINMDSVGFDTKPFSTPPYYTIRGGYWQDESAWEMELVHHKLYAKTSDLDPQVNNFEITDGYNLLYVNRAVQARPNWNARVGLGLVIPHPDVTVNGERSHGGYQLGGGSAQFALEREFALSEQWLLSLEGKVSYSYAQITLDYGEAVVPNTALHLVGQVKFRP